VSHRIEAAINENRQLEAAVFAGGGTHVPPIALTRKFRSRAAPKKQGGVAGAAGAAGAAGGGKGAQGSIAAAKAGVHQHHRKKRGARKGPPRPPGKGSAASATGGSAEKGTSLLNLAGGPASPRGSPETLALVKHAQHLTMMTPMAAPPEMPSTVRNRDWGGTKVRLRAKQSLPRFLG
jgi:hypothetical protein